MKIAKFKTTRKAMMGIAMAITCSLPWSSAQADMRKYEQCRKEAFVNVLLSKSAPFLFFSLAVEMNQCLQHLTPEELSKVEKERAIDNIS
ncbi:MAG: hypothetical protein V7739_12700 [Motiliproteus sp.]